MLLVAPMVDHEPWYDRCFHLFHHLRAPLAFLVSSRGLGKWLRFQAAFVCRTPTVERLPTCIFTRGAMAAKMSA
jgi:hypothetical protein